MVPLGLAAVEGALLGLAVVMGFAVLIGSSVIGWFITGKPPWQR